MAKFDSAAGQGGLPGAPGETMPGSTGFYYITPSDEWDRTTMSGRRSNLWLVTLPSYIWKELIKGVLLSTLVFSLVLMAVFAGQVMKDGIGVDTLLLVLPNFVPLICPFVLPLAIFTGILICYSRLSKDNEILAAYAGGINPLWLMLPALLTSVVAIFITLTLNETALLPAIKNIERLVVNDQANILSHMMTRPGNLTVPTGSEFIAMSKLDPDRDPERRSSLDITRFAMPGENSGERWDPRFPHPTKRIVARDHVIQDLSDEGHQEMVLKMSISKPIFQDLNTADINKTFIADGESGEERIILNSRPKVTINGSRSAFWPILELQRTRQVALHDLAKTDEAIANAGDMADPYRDSLLATRQRTECTVMVRTAEINMRLSLCFSCLAFAIMGIPLGMRTRGTIASSFAWGIISAGVYFMLLKSFELQVARGLLPYWVIWIPDVLVVIAGVILWKRSFAAR